MADDNEPLGSGASPMFPPSIPQDDITHPPPISRRDTFSSKASESDPERVDTCRICRSEGTIEEPLFYPCKCSGSIKFVHQECLMEWLSHSHKKHCELCKTPFRFTKLYDANMPQKLPWRVFVKRACWHVIQTLVRGCRIILVASVWLGFVPWAIRWVWRWLFWITDAAWARETFMERMTNLAKQQEGGSLSKILSMSELPADEWLSNIAHKVFSSTNWTWDVKATNQSEGPILYNSLNTLAKTLGFARADNSTMQHIAPDVDTSVLSSWSYLATLTPNPRINRILLDIFEGQIITCVVIVGFILVFLIREWVVQQQPIVNLDNVAPVPQDQQQQEEIANALQANNDRLQRQTELLDKARAQLHELELENARLSALTTELSEDLSVEYVGWEGLKTLIDEANDHWRLGTDEGRVQFVLGANKVVQQIGSARNAGLDLDEFTDKVYNELAQLSKDEYLAWKNVMMTEVDNASERLSSAELTTEETVDKTAVVSETPASASTRPSLPRRDSVSRALGIQRLLQEPDITAATGPERDPIGQASAESAQETNAADKGSNVFDPLPITNAGPDAKINIRVGRIRKTQVIPKPKVEPSAVKALETDREPSLTAPQEDASSREISETDRGTPEVPADSIDTAPNDNPFHPDGVLPAERRNSESFSNRVASVFREEFGLDDPDIIPPAAGTDLRATAEPVSLTASDTGVTQPNANAAPPSYAQQLVDWLWGDIQLPAAPEPVPAPEVEIQQAQGQEPGQEAPFVPNEVNRGDRGGAPALPADQLRHDPEVLAAAQQAGLDAEGLDAALEQADEDIEGVLELIGLQGPIIGLFQTSAFCTLLVACTILCAVILPYFGGKTVLNLIDDPGHFLVKMPLQAAGAIADLVIDLTLFLGGGSVMLVAMGLKALLAVAHKWIPPRTSISVAQRVFEYANATVANSGSRLQGLMVSADTTVRHDLDVLSLSWAFLCLSAHAHASLNTIRDETNAVLGLVGSVVTWLVENTSSGTVSTEFGRIFARLTYASVSSTSRAAGAAVHHRMQQVLDLIADIRHDTVTISSPQVALDPALVYWNSADRFLAILTGYIALAALASVYVAVDTPITRTDSGRRTEKMIRDTLRQAGGVLKVILIISIEMLVFPLYCGLLLDSAFLPLFRNENLASRWDFAVRRPYTFCFVHWFVGTCYMFHFALFVGMCRKILRKGVLWFIRDPDDPTFHPVRDVLERNVATQLRKIAFSALVYGALVILCLGGVIWAISQVLEDIFPIRWVSTEPIFEFPMDLLLYNFVTPLVIRLFKPSDAVASMYAWWLRRCARVLRLSHFLFDDRRTDEEGHVLHASWTSLLLMRRPKEKPEQAIQASGPGEAATHLEIRFQKDGKYVLTPCNDQYRPPKPGEAFLHADDDDVYITDKNGVRNDHFAKVYVPSFFRVRIAAFMVCLWVFSALTGLCTTLLPLIFGRRLLVLIAPDIPLNDIHAYSAGAYILGGAAYLLLKSPAGLQYAKARAARTDLMAWVGPTRRFVFRAFKCAYFYGFIGAVVPAIFALLLQMYVIMPLHTWLVASASIPPSTPVDAVATVNETLGTATSADIGKVANLAEHTVHVFQDYALGLLYLRIAGRLIVGAPASRAAEAFRRITADGYLDPNIRLATRFFVLPATVVTAVVLFLPPSLVWAVATATHCITPAMEIETDFIIRLYRYSYPVAASSVVLVLGMGELGKATSRWRARIRDEVYLVGERLHNFGEKKPPSGSKSVVRKER